MRCALMLLTLGLAWLGPGIVRADEIAHLNETNIVRFLASYQEQLGEIRSTYRELEHLEPPLRDRSDHVLAPESLENRLKTLALFQKTVQQAQSHPENFVLVLRLFIQTESLTEDLSSLSQLCFDNDQEELAQRLNRLSATMESNKHLVEGYALHLADTVQRRLQDLEREIQNLRARLARTGKTKRRPASRSAP